MRLDSPRIRPLEKEAWDDDAQELMRPFANQDRVFNIFKTLANHPNLAKRWIVFAHHILGKATLSDRDRELLTLRIGYLANAALFLASDEAKFIIGVNLPVDGGQSARIS